MEGYSVVGLDLNLSSNLLLPAIRLCGMIGPMWRFVMTVELSLIFVRVCGVFFCFFFTYKDNVA